MAELIPFPTESRPYMEGPAICLHCENEWTQVSELGETAFDCPRCKLSKGVYKTLITPEKCMVCDCGSPIFFVNPEGTFSCTLCGYEYDHVGE
jgi:hypothetical protein